MLRGNLLHSLYSPQRPFLSYPHHAIIDTNFFDAANTGRTGAKNEKIHGQRLPSRDKNCSEVV